MLPHFDECITLTCTLRLRLVTRCYCQELAAKIPLEWSATEAATESGRSSPCDSEGVYVCVHVHDGGRVLGVKVSK